MSAHIALKHKCSPSSAHAMLELAIVLPLITMIGLSFLEFSSAFSIHQRLGTISKEVANLASRECITLANSCVQNIDIYASTVLPGAETIVSVYKYNDNRRTGIVSATRIAVYPSSGKTASNKSSHYSSSRVISEILSLSNDNPLAVISEVFFEHTPIAKISITSGKYYEATIF